METVIEKVVVVANGSNGADCQEDVLGRSGIVDCHMSRQRESSVLLEDTDTVGMCTMCFLDINSRIQICCIGRTIEAWEKLESPGSKSVVPIKKRAAVNDRVVASVMCHGLHHAKLIDQALSLVANVEESDASITAEANIEAKSHPFNVLLLHIDVESWSSRCNLYRRRQCIISHWLLAQVGVGASPSVVGSAIVAIAIEIWRLIGLAESCQ